MATQEIVYFKACRLANEIIEKQNFQFPKDKNPTTVAQYFKKHKTKCLSKFTNT